MSELVTQETKAAGELMIGAPMSIEAITRRIATVQAIMKNVMKPGLHYAPIPGCGPKPSLLQPGAEILGLAFGLIPNYDVKRIDMENGHREYEVICSLIDRTGCIVGGGLGLCSSMESKYRFRTGEVIDTGKKVPPAYWKERDQELIGGKGFQTKKIDDVWKIVQAGPKVENENPADTFNTVMKMAKKRAYVDAIKSTSAASDLVTQDIEDFPSLMAFNAAYQPEQPEQPEQTSKTKPPTKTQKKTSEKRVKLAFEDLMKAVEKSCKAAEIDQPSFEERLDSYMKTLYDIDNLSSDDIEAIMNKLPDLINIVLQEKAAGNDQEEIIE